MIHFDRKVSQACPSGYQLDRLLAGELTHPSPLRRHLAGCAPCAGRLAEMEELRERFHDRRRSAGGRALLRVIEGGPVAPAPVPGRARGARSRWQLAVGALAAAGLLALVVARGGSNEPGLAAAPAARTRIKGDGVQVHLYVTHRGRARAGGPGEIVHPGDILSFASSSEQAGYLAILSRDGDGVGSVYVADRGRALAIAPGSGVPLPRGVKLDGVLGRETLFVLACDRPVAVEPLRRALGDSAAPLGAPAGCRIEAMHIEKRSAP
jgi:hypothetical protein